MSSSIVHLNDSTMHVVHGPQTNYTNCTIYNNTSMLQSLLGWIYEAEGVFQLQTNADRLSIDGSRHQIHGQTIVLRARNASQQREHGLLKGKHLQIGSVIRIPRFGFTVVVSLK
jgi:hypothetical protein